MSQPRCMKCGCWERIQSSEGVKCAACGHHQFKMTEPPEMFKPLEGGQIPPQRCMYSQVCASAGKLCKWTILKQRNNPRLLIGGL
jgi:DNA-directed RNA polymerase subunit RPC12/RpoP